MTQTIRDDGMQTFSLDPRRWPVGFLFSRSPLVRRSDRLEVLAIAFALAISLLALPIVATIATDVHQANRGIYAEQSRTRHRAWIPTQGSTYVAPLSGHPAEEARRWVRNATPQGSPVEQWVDDAGNWVAPPTPLSRAAYDAVGMALALEGLVVLTAAVLVLRHTLAALPHPVLPVGSRARPCSQRWRARSRQRQSALMADVICRRRHQLGCVTAQFA